MKIKDNILYFHDFLTNEEITLAEITHFKGIFLSNGIEIGNITTTETPPFRDNMSYDILLFDWGAASLGNSCLEHYCKYILEEAIEKPNRIYIMVSNLTAMAMKEAQWSFLNANGVIPNNVFLNIPDACEYIKKLIKN